MVATRGGTMKLLATASAVLLSAATTVAAQTLDELKNDGQLNDALKTDNVLTYGMGYHQQRYSPLNQINPGTIKRLVPVWSLSLDNNWGEQAQPIVYNGVMYVTNARHTVAIDVGSGSAWITGSYDPQLDLMYWGIGNPAPWASQSRTGDNLYTSSVLALRPKTGEIVWHYQFTPNDAYDYDACWELILAELKVNGKMRKVAMQLNRNGFLYVLDRATGELISAKAYEKVNWASHIDMKTGRPVETDIAKSIRDMKATEHWPSTRGAKNWQHAAFNPKTGLLYANTLHEGRMYKHLETKPFEKGARYMYIENLPLPSAAGQPVGHIEAIDPLTAEKKWRVPLLDFQIWSAMLASGELLFTGKETGEFIALDAATGKQLWQFQTGSGINAMPVTYTHKGKQYVTVLSGIGGLYWNINRERLKDMVPQGGSVWTFALLPE